MGNTKSQLLQTQNPELVSRDSDYFYTYDQSMKEIHIKDGKPYGIMGSFEESLIPGSMVGSCLRNDNNIFARQTQAVTG